MALEKIYLKNQRVMTPMGPATVLGFEAFTPEGSTDTPSDFDTGRRIIVALDDPEKWVFSSQGLNPHMFRHEVEAIPV